MTRRKDERNAKIRALVEAGRSFQSVADQFRLSRQRVYQICRSEPADAPFPYARAEKKERAANPVSLSDRIVAGRLDRGLTCSELAHYAGVPRQSIVDWESGSKEPNAESIRRLSIALDVSAHWLLFGTDFQKS